MVLPLLQIDRARRRQRHGRVARAEALGIGRGLVSYRAAWQKGGMIYTAELETATSGHGDMHDLTGEVTQVVRASAIASGVVHLFVVGSTAALGTIEFEPGLQEDLPEILDRLMPPSRDYGHERAWHDGNGHSHLQATTLGPSLTVPVRDRALVLGTWQQIFLLECDVRPRRRRVVATVMGE